MTAGRPRRERAAWAMAWALALTSIALLGRADDALVSGDDLQRMLAPLDTRDDGARHAAASVIAGLGAGATTAIAGQLADLRKVETDLTSVLQAALAQSPDGSDDEPDLFEGLLRISKSDDAAYRTALTTACLLRALAHIATTPAVVELVLASADHHAAFRADVERSLKLLGERATAGLIRATKHPVLGKWATAELEAMNKKTPGDCVQTRSNQVLGDVLHAYGAIHDLDALSVVLSFVNSERAPVREAARDTVTAYGEDALAKLRDAYANFVGRSAPDGRSAAQPGQEWTAAQVAKELFAAYDRARLGDVTALLEEGLATHKDGKLAEAVGAFDKVLAREPLLDRRVEMVPAYVLYAQSIEEADRPNALAYFRKAERLDPQGPRVAQIQSEIATLEGLDLLARGVADRETFRRAVTLDPANTRAHAELDRLDDEAEAREGRVHNWTLAAGALAVALAGILLFARRRGR